MLHAFNNWRLARKIFLSFAPIFLVVVTLGGMAVISNRTVTASEEKHVNQALPVVYSASKIQGTLREYRIILYSYLNAAGSAEIAELDQRMSGTHGALHAEIERIAKIGDPLLTPDIARLRNAVAALEDVNGRILTLGRQSHGQALKLLKADGFTASHAALDAADGVMAQVVRDSMDKGTATRAFTDRIFYLVLVLAVVSIVILSLVWWLFARTVARPMTELAQITTALAEGRESAVPHRDRRDELGEIANAVEQFRLAAIARQERDRESGQSQQIVTTALGQCLAAIAHGDLTADVRDEFPGEMASLKTNFNEALARLREMIGSVANSAGSIRTGSSEIAQAAEDLARRTESNAASLQETSAALTQIDDRLKATAKAAGRTVERADQATTTVGTGRAVAVQAVQAMERVRESATGIDSVIEGLDKIAFQTRVLAMNAAVEAGRAGDAGRGFAVVADLVSSLAMRAEEEAKRARDQLTVTQTDVVMAVEAVQKVDGALSDISGDVGAVHALLESMATDNQAQSSAITQISAAIGSMDQSTQQNAAMVEQTSAAARNLNAEVTSLAEQAALFRIPDNGRRIAKAKAAAITVAPAANPYVSPVKPLPIPAMAIASGALNGAADGDWSDF